MIGVLRNQAKIIWAKGDRTMSDRAKIRFLKVLEEHKVEAVERFSIIASAAKALANAEEYGFEITEESVEETLKDLMCIV